MPESVLAEVHAWIAALAAIVAVALGILGLAAAVLRLPTGRVRRWLDLAALLLIGVVAVAAMVGPVVLLVVGPPDDWLHLLYAAVALAAVPGARLVAGWRGSSRIGLWMAAGSLLTLGALLRLWQTGG